MEQYTVKNKRVFSCDTVSCVLQNILYIAHYIFSNTASHSSCKLNTAVATAAKRLIKSPTNRH